MTNVVSTSNAEEASMPESTPRYKTIWYVSKYASLPGSNAGLRGISLCREFASQGHEAILINSRASHYFHEIPGGQQRRFGSFTRSDHWGVSTYTHQTIQYQATASAKRVLSWLHFEWGLFALPTKSLPRPTHIIASSLSLPTVLNGYRLARKFGARLIFEVRDIWPLTLTVETALTKKHVAVRFLSWIEKFAYENADVVVGTMPNLSEHVRRTVGHPIRVETIGLGLDLELEEVARSRSIRPMNRQFSLTYAGSIGRSNDLHLLLEAASTFESNAGIIFNFYGRGDLLKRLSEKYSSYPNIIFHGARPRSELLEILKSSDAFFFAAADSEIWKYGQSLHKVVEYMALGRPIIAAYSGFTSMIDEAKCGVFVRSDDTDLIREQILILKGMSPTERNTMGERGRAWILKNRTYAKLAEKYLEILESL